MSDEQTILFRPSRFSGTESLSEIRVTGDDGTEYLLTDRNAESDADQPATGHYVFTTITKITDDGD